MKKIILLAAVLLFSVNAYPHNKDIAKASIDKADKAYDELDKREELKDLIPYKIYSIAAINLYKAKEKFSEKKFSEAYYFASIAVIQFESAAVNAEASKEKNPGSAKKNKSDISAHDGSDEPAEGGDDTADASDGNPLLSAGLVKKGQVFTSSISDRDIFFANSFKIHYAGADSVSKIIKVMKAYPESKITIVGHTSRSDTTGISLTKAISARNYMIRKGIKRGRITTSGASNREVMHTPLGYKRVDRVEFIITNITKIKSDNEDEEVEEESKENETTGEEKDK